MVSTTGLESAWKCDEASGNLLDAHGTNELTVNNAVGAATGKLGGARDFESGSSQYFSLADNASISVGDIDFSCDFWVNLESKAASQTFVGQWDGPSNQRSWRVEYDLSNDRFIFVVSSNGTGAANQLIVTANSFGSPSLATWYHIVAWHDAVANTINIQVNNGTVDSAAWTGGVHNSTAGFKIGAINATPSQYTDGLLDAVNFWKRALATQDRADLWNSGNGLAYPFTAGTTATVGLRAAGHLATAATKASTATVALAATARGATAAAKASSATTGERGTGLLTTAGAASRAASVALRGAGLLRSAGGAAPPEFSEAAAARGMAWMQATGVRGSLGTLTLSGRGRLAVAASRAATAQTAIRGSGRLSGAVASGRLAVASLRGQGRMQIAAGTLLLPAIRAAASDAAYGGATASDAALVGAAASDSEG